MKQISHRLAIFALALCMISIYACAGDSTKVANKNAAPPGDVTLTMPAGFKATVFADGLGSARHLAATSNGYVYVKLANKKAGKTIVRLRDANGDGTAEDIVSFGTFTGTGIAIGNGYLYASSDEEVFRYKLDSNNKVI